MLSSFQKHDWQVVESDTIWDASTKVALDAETAEKVLKIVNVLEDLDDVQTVYTNADIAPEIFESISS